MPEAVKVLPAKDWLSLLEVSLLRTFCKSDASSECSETRPTDRLFNDWTAWK